MQLNDFAAALDILLKVPESSGDRSLNGLQIGGNWLVNRVAVALDARLSTVRMAVAAKADVLVVHHGLFWGHLFPWTGPQFELLKEVVSHRLGVYACHLPLDSHPDFGINLRWAERLGLDAAEPFTEAAGFPLGMCGALDRTIAITDLAQLVEGFTGETVQVRPHGPNRVGRVAVLAGSIGPTEVAAAAAAGAHALVTGEASLPADIAGELHGIHLLFAGHTATELVGMESLQAEIESRMSLETVMLHEATGV